MRYKPCCGNQTDGLGVVLQGIQGVMLALIRKLSALVAAVKTALADSEYHDGLTTRCNRSALRQFY